MSISPPTALIWPFASARRRSPRSNPARSASCNPSWVASPEYLAGHEAPTHPDDLQKPHLHHRQQPADLRRVGALSHEGRELTVQVPSRFTVNSARVTRDLARRGEGIAFCPPFILGDDLDTGRLVQLLPEFKGATHPISIVYLEGRTLPRKVRALIEFAVQDYRGARTS